LGAVLAAAAVAFTPPARAQKLTDRTMPLPETSVRQRQLEPPPGAVASGGMYEVWRVAAPPELLLQWYMRSLNRLSPIKDGVLDTANIIMGDTRPPMTYHITLHTFKDKCADPVETTPASTDPPTACKRWNLGKEKRRILDNNRVGYEWGEWIQKITFTWFIRELNGALVRRQIELLDTGLSNDWKRYTLVTQITLQRDVLEPATQ
jgi:hypothetical protein